MNFSKHKLMGDQSCGLFKVSSVVHNMIKPSLKKSLLLEQSLLDLPTISDYKQFKFDARFSRGTRGNKCRKLWQEQIIMWLDRGRMNPFESTGCSSHCGTSYPDTAVSTCRAMCRIHIAQCWSGNYFHIVDMDVYISLK